MKNFKATLPGLLVDPFEARCSSTWSTSSNNIHQVKFTVMYLKYSTIRIVFKVFHQGQCFFYNISTSGY